MSMATRDESVKRIPGTTFIVDGFQCRGEGLIYFLTHYHSDHTWGLTKYAV